MPNTICCTFTAVPHSSGMWLMRRYSTARSPSHESNTATTAWRSCSRGSCGKSSPVWLAVEGIEAVGERLEVVHRELGVELDAGGRLRALIARSSTAPRDPPAHVPNICTKRRYESQANRSLSVTARGPPRLVAQPEIEHGVEHPASTRGRPSGPTPATGRSRHPGASRLPPRGARVPRSPGPRAPGAPRDPHALYASARLGRDREARGHALLAPSTRVISATFAPFRPTVPHVARSVGEGVDELGGGGGRHGRDRSCPAPLFPGTRLRRTWARRSIVSAIARSACHRAGPAATGTRPAAGPATRRGTRAPRRRAGTNPPRSPRTPLHRRSARTRPGARARRRSREAELGGEPRGEQQLHPERQRLRTGGGGRIAVEQGQLVAEQVVGGAVGLGRVEQAQHGLARLAGPLERGAVLAERRVGVQRVHR